jgi:lambda repressor-like predicted transcriptional regulator
MNLYNLHSEPETLDHHDTAFERVPRLVWEKYWDKSAELKKREEILAKDAKTAYVYASSVLKGPFPAGEAAIAKDAWCAYLYARDVLQKPWPAGEAAIAKNASLAYSYALLVLEKPFPAGEALSQWTRITRAGMPWMF